MDYMNSQQTNQGMERFQSFIATRLQSDANPKDVYYELISAGLGKKDAGQLLSATIATLIEQGLFDPTYFDEAEAYVPKEEKTDVVNESNMTNQATQAEQGEYTASYDEENDAVANQFFGSDVDKEETQGMVGQMRKGGMLDRSDLPQEVKEQYQDKQPVSFDKIEKYYNPVSNIEFPSLSEYLPNYDIVSWDDISMQQSEKSQKRDGGSSKKRFVNNVMNLVRAKEGMESENQQIASGERQDTLLNEVAAIKKDFKSALKGSADEALSKSVYDNALKLGDPKLIQMVQGMNEEQPMHQMPDGTMMPGATHGETLQSQQGMMRDGGLPKHNLKGIVKSGQQGSNALSKFFGFGSKGRGTLSIPGNQYASVFNDAMGGGLNLKNDFTTFSSDEMAKLAQVSKIINMGQDVSLANNKSVRKILENEKRFQNVSDDDLRILLGADRDGLRKRIDAGFDVFGDQRNQILQKQERALISGNTPDWKIGFGEVNKRNLFNDMSESDAIKLFESDPYLMQKYRMLYGKPGKTDVHPMMHMLYKDNFPNARAMTETLKEGVNLAYDQADVGSILTGATDLSTDSYPMTYGMMRRFANNAEGLGLYKDPLLYGYAPVSDHGYLDSYYFDKKKVQEFDDIGDIKSPMPGMSLLETHQKMRKDLNQKYKNMSSDYLFNQINKIDERYGDSWLEKFGALSNPADGKTYFPLVGMGKTQKKGKLLEEGGMVDNELYKFIAGGDDPMYAPGGATVGSYMDTEPGGPFDPTVYNPAVSNLITPIDSPEVLASSIEEGDQDDPVETNPVKRFVRNSTINYVPGNTIHITPWQARRMMKGKDPFKRRGVLGQLGDMLIPGNIGPRYNFGTMQYPQVRTTSTGYKFAPDAMISLDGKGKGRGERMLSKIKNKASDVISNVSDNISDSMSDRQELRNKIKNINDSDYSMKTKMAIKRGERQAYRIDKRAERNPEGRVINRTTRDRSGGAGERLADRLFPNRDLDMKTRLQIAGSKIANSGLSKFIPGMAEGGLPIANHGLENDIELTKRDQIRLAKGKMINGLKYPTKYNQPHDSDVYGFKEINTTTENENFDRKVMNTGVVANKFPDGTNNVQYSGSKDGKPYTYNTDNNFAYYDGQKVDINPELNKAIAGIAGYINRDGGIPMANNGYELTQGVNSNPVVLGDDIAGQINSDKFNPEPSYAFPSMNEMDPTLTVPDNRTEDEKYMSSIQVDPNQVQDPITNEDVEAKKQQRKMIKAEKFTKTTDPTAGLLLGTSLIKGAANKITNSQNVNAAQDAAANNQMYNSMGSSPVQVQKFSGREGTNTGLIGSRETGSNTSSFNSVTSQYGGFMEEGGVSEEYDYISLDGLSDDEIQQYLDMGGVIEYQ